MSPETARTVLYALTAVWFVALVISHEFVRRTERRLAERASPRPEAYFDELDPGDSKANEESVALKGDPADLANRLASALARDGLPAYGPVRLTEVNDRRVSFEGVGLIQRRGSGMKVHGAVDFRPAPNGQTEAVLSVDLPSAKGMILAAKILQGVGLAALVGLFWLMSSVVVDHPNGGVRAQVIQMVQMIHLIWPPFLLAGLARTYRRVARDQMRAMVGNLPYLAA